MLEKETGRQALRQIPQYKENQMERGDVNLYGRAERPPSGCFFQLKALTCGRGGLSVGRRFCSGGIVRSRLGAT